MSSGSIAWDFYLKTPLTSWDNVILNGKKRGLYFPGELMAKIRIARAVNGWGGRKWVVLLRALMYQHSCPHWASPRVREGNWLVAETAVKLIDLLLRLPWSHCHGWRCAGSRVLLAEPRQGMFFCPVMGKGGCKQWQVVEWTCCNFKSPLQSLKLIITVRQRRQHFFYAGLFSVGCNNILDGVVFFL